MIRCEICYKRYNIITNSHLRKHNITPSEYKSLYGTDSLTPDSIRHKMSSMYKGKGNPNYGNHSNKGMIPWNLGVPSKKKGLTFEQMYGDKHAKEMRQAISNRRKGKKMNFSKEVLDKFRKHCEKMNQMDRSEIGILISKSLKGKFLGSKNPNWCGGLSFEPYTSDFNDNIKEFIRSRDNFICQLCGTKENGKKHCTHHINYNKPESNPENLITLCRSCNSRVNFNREYYVIYLTNLMEDKKMKEINIEDFATRNWLVNMGELGLEGTQNGGPR